MQDLSPKARVYGAALLGLNLENPNSMDLQTLGALGIHQVEKRHVSFVLWCRGIAAGSTPEDLAHYLAPVHAANEMLEALEAARNHPSLYRTCELLHRLCNLS